MLGVRRGVDGVSLKYSLASGECLYDNNLRYKKH